MKRILLLALVLVTVPAFAQDDIVLSNSEIDALFGGGGRGGRGGNNNNNLIPDPVGLMTQFKDLLKAGKVPLDKSQEKPLQTLLETESNAIRTFAQASSQGNQITRIDALVTKHNTDLLNQMKADLTPEQLALLMKGEQDKKVCLVMLDLVNFQQLGNNAQNLPSRPTCTNGASTTVQRLAPLSDLLAKGKKPLTSDQQKKFAALIEARLPMMQQDARDQGLPNNLFNRNNNNAQVSSAQNVKTYNALVARHNSDLLNQMKADLTPEQVALVTKGEQDKKLCLVMLDMDYQQLGNRGGGRGGGGGGRGGGGGGGRGGPGGGDFNAGDLGGDFTVPGFGGGGGGNPGEDLLGRAPCTDDNSSTIQRLAPLASLLTKGKKPLTADQETKFGTLIEEKLPVMSQDGKDQGLPNGIFSYRIGNPTVNVQTLTNNIVSTIMSSLGIPNQNNNNNNRGGGGRGNNNGGGNNGNNNGGGRGNNNNLQADIQKKNEELLDKVAAMLKPEQQPIIKKIKYDQIKSRGPVDKYRAILEEEGTPLAPEQLTQIQQILNASNQAVRTFAQGVVTTEINTLAPGTLESAAKQILQQQQQQPPPQNQDPRQNRGNNSNPNNVNQNGVAQQIVAKVISQVSVQHARQDKVAADTIMSRVLTPAQQASYKVHQMN